MCSIANKFDIENREHIMLLRKLLNFEYNQRPNSYINMYNVDTYLKCFPFVIHIATITQICVWVCLCICVCLCVCLDSVGFPGCHFISDWNNTPSTTQRDIHSAKERIRSVRASYFAHTEHRVGWLCEYMLNTCNTSQRSTRSCFASFEVH